MASMIPDISSKDILNIGERLVYEALKNQLPNDWIVRYHYPFCWFNNGFLRDCEVDFIVLAPQKGLMFLEVKSSYGFDCDRGIWHRIKRDGRREITHNPMEQAERAKHRVVEKIAKDRFRKDKKDFPGIFGHMIIYPLGEVVGKYPESTAKQTIVTRTGMNDLFQLIASNFNMWGTQEQGDRFTSGAMNEVCDFLEDNCRFIQVEASDRDVDERLIEELTYEQYVAFQRVLGNPRVIISGPAGSGKTMIADWAAKGFAHAKEGNRVLFLCYNKVLETWLRRRVDGCENVGVDVRSYFSLCREWAIKASLPYNPPSDYHAQEEFFANTAPNIFSDALGKMEDSLEKYDVVLVDEAHDFHENWWVSVQLLLKDPDKGALYIFRDPLQAGVYGHGKAYPDAGMVFYSLMENCRNTVNINQYSSSIVERDIPSSDRSPEGIPPIILSANENHSHRAQTVRNAVLELIKDGYSLSQIAILSPFSEHNDKSFLARLKKKIQGHNVCGGAGKVSEWQDGKVIWASTIKAFKGLEADCVIIADIYEPDGRTLFWADLYVACTRAKHRLILVPMTDDAADYLRSKYTAKTTRVFNVKNTR